MSLSINGLLHALPLACLGVIVAGCHQAFGAPGTSSAEGPELIREVFPGWNEDRKEFPYAAFNQKPISETSASSLNVTPEQIVKLSDSEIVLLTKGAMPSPGHSSPALLGAYWFTLTDGRWRLASRQDEVAWLGSSGDFGAIDLKPLANGVFGVFVEVFWAGGGTDSSWLEVFSLDKTSAKPVLSNLSILQSENNAFAYDCEALLNSAPAKPIKMKVEAGGMTDRCMQLFATWELVPARPGEYAEIRSHQSKAKVEFQTLSIRKGYYRDEGEYSVRVGRQESNLVYRYSREKHTYVLTAGKDLSERF